MSHIRVNMCLKIFKLLNRNKEHFVSRTNTAAKARTTTLNEELGQIQYIFRYCKSLVLTENAEEFRDIRDKREIRDIRDMIFISGKRTAIQS